MTPLALACQNKNTSTKSIIQTFLKTRPQEVYIILDGGWTPIHLSVWYEASVDTVRTLVHAFPQGCFLKTWSSHHTPLEMYWAHCDYQIGEDKND